MPDDFKKNHTFSTGPGKEGRQALTRPDSPFEGLTVEEMDLQWQQTFDNIPDFVSLHDRNFRIVKANQALLKALHLPEEGRYWGIPASVCFITVIDPGRSVLSRIPFTMDNHTAKNSTNHI